MDSTLIEKIVRDSVKVTNHHVALAKGFLLNSTDIFIETRQKINEFVQQQGYSKPKQIVIHDTVPIDPQLDQLRGYFIFSIAFCEAILSLVNNGYFMSKSSYGEILDANVEWTTVVPGSGGHSSGSDFEQFKFMVPTQLVRSFSKREDTFPFGDPDVFVLKLGIPNAHSEVIEALKDTIQCFKRDLFHPSILMLSKALEGAWIELGISLSKAVSSKKGEIPTEEFIEKLKGQDSFVWKVREVVKLYEKQDWFKHIKIASNIDLNMLREIQSWTDIVRDSRNAIHFGFESSSPNTYEKASVLLLNAVKNFREMYKLKEFSDKESSTN